MNAISLGYFGYCKARFKNRRCGRKGLYRIKLALKPMGKVFGRTSARSFGPRSLLRVREAYISHGYARFTVNEYTAIVKDAFRWAVREEMLPPSVHHALLALTGLRAGDTVAPEPQRVTPVPDQHVDAVLPFVSRQVAAMVQLQRVTGMRPGEAVIMRGCDLDTTGKLWSYVPSFHKTEHMGRTRTIYIGKAGQRFIKPFLRANLQDYLFSPHDAAAERMQTKRTERKTKVQPSQRNRGKRRPKRAPGARYSTASYGYAIRRACIKIKGPVWGPNRLRHSFATKVRGEFGLETASILLGHGSSKITDAHYAQADLTKAIRAVRKIG